MIPCCYLLRQLVGQVRIFANFYINLCEQCLSIEITQNFHFLYINDICSKVVIEIFAISVTKFGHCNYVYSKRFGGKEKVLYYLSKY